MSAQTSNVIALPARDATGSATLSGMPRARISTTVDRDRLRECRSLVQAPDSVLFDRALALLLEALRAEEEIKALQAMPYEQDPDLTWEAPTGPDLPYDGEVPADVMALAEERRHTAP